MTTRISHNGVRFTMALLACAATQAATYTWTVDASGLGAKVQQRYGQTAQPTQHSVWFAGTGTASVWLESIDGAYISPSITIHESIGYFTTGDGSWQEPVLAAGNIILTLEQSAMVWSPGLQARLVADTTGAINRVMAFAPAHEFATQSWFSTAAAVTPRDQLPSDDELAEVAGVPEPSTLLLIAPAMAAVFFKRVLKRRNTMRSFSAVLLFTAGIVQAAPIAGGSCLGSGTLAEYVALGPTGCTLGSVAVLAPFVSDNPFLNTFEETPATVTVSDLGAGRFELGLTGTNTAFTFSVTKTSPTATIIGPYTLGISVTGCPEPTLNVLTCTAGGVDYLVARNGGGGGPKRPQILRLLATSDPSSQFTGSVQFEVSEAVPEPSSMMLMAPALLGLAASRRIRERCIAGRFRR
jgi:hypothetical protein